MINPRFPHTLRMILPNVDSHGDPVTDDEGNPIETYGEIVCGIIRDNVPQKGANGRFLTEVKTEIPFGYRTSTGNSKTSGDVVVCDYKLACPAFFTPMPTGTVLELTDYSRTYRVSVVKQTTYNFGSNIWVDEIKN